MAHLQIFEKERCSKNRSTATFYSPSFIHSLLWAVWVHTWANDGYCFNLSEDLLIVSLFFEYSFWLLNAFVRLDLDRPQWETLWQRPLLPEGWHCPLAQRSPGNPGATGWSKVLPHPGLNGTLSKRPAGQSPTENNLLCFVAAVSVSRVKLNCIWMFK